MKNSIQPGNVLPFVADAAIISGQVVAIGAVLGVSQGDVADTEEGLAQITGVFSVPKVSAAVIKNGETLTWDISAAAFDDNAATAATGDITGQCAFAWGDFGAGETTMLVKFTGVPGTVKA